MSVSAVRFVCGGAPLFVVACGQVVTVDSIGVGGSGVVADAGVPSGDGAGGSAGNGTNDAAVPDGSCEDPGAWPGCVSDAECNPGEKCVEFFAGGFNVCVQPPEPATTCSFSSYPPDECGCDGGVCPAGQTCYAVPHTGGCMFWSSNQCLEGCKSDSDCNGGVCFAAGYPSPASYPLPVAFCGYASCRTDGDCSPCRRCRTAWFWTSKCSLPEFNGLRCTCVDDAECKPGEFCSYGICRW